MKARSKFINRTISFIYLGLFVLGIACVALGTVQVVNLYKENQRLLEIKENLENGITKQDTFEEFHFDEYYSVFVEDGYALYDDKENETTIFFTKWSNYNGSTFFYLSLMYIIFGDKWWIKQMK